MKRLLIVILMLLLLAGCGIGLPESSVPTGTESTEPPEFIQYAIIIPDFPRKCKRGKSDLIIF